MTFQQVIGMSVLAALLAPAVSPAADHPLTLSEAVRRALQKNESLVVERESVAAAEGLIRESKGAYDPVLGMDGGWFRTTEPLRSLTGTGSLEVAPEFESFDAGLGLRQKLPTGGELLLRARGIKVTDEGFVILSPSYATRAGVELRQPLLRDRGNDETDRNIKVAEAGRDAADASLRRALSETVAAVERAYWSLVEARLDVGVREESIRLAEEQLTETRHRVDTGSVPQTELAQPRAELERRRGELFASREGLARAENALKLLILDGVEDALWTASLVPVDEVSVEIAPVDVATQMEHALAARPELAIARAFVGRRKAETAFAKDGLWPALDIILSYDRFGLAGSREPAFGPDPALTSLEGEWSESFESLRDGDFDAARIALEIELPIGNREARGRAEAARHFERQAEVDLARVRKRIRAEVLDAAAALETAGQRVEAAQSQREAAEIQLSAERDRYATGLSTNFLVLTRQNDLSRARLDEISARTDYRTARTEMARASGRLVQRDDVGGETR